MKVKVWDLPTRLFHWLLVACFATAFYTSQSEWMLGYHSVAGYIAGVLVVFRIIWGFAGNRFARFSEFIKGYSAIRSYLLDTIQHHPPRYLGHNPAVAIMVIFMLTLVLTIVTTGLITFAGEELRGPLAGLFSFSTAEYTSEFHEFLAILAVVVVVIHICAALIHDFYFKENIILAMLTGVKDDEREWSESVAHMPEKGHPATRLVVWMLITVLGGAFFIYLPYTGGGEGYSTPKVRTETGGLADVMVNETWIDECGSSCHNAFHPTLLPSRSWVKVMDGLDEHFGDDASLDDETAGEIREFLVSNAAEVANSEAAVKILRSIPPGSAPIRITETPYWVRKHSDIKKEVYARKSVISKSNCKACHPGAVKGSFEDADISVPER